MREKLTKEELDEYLGKEEAKEFYDFLELYNKIPEGGVIRQLAPSVNKDFLRSPIKWSVKNHMTGYLPVLLLFVSFFCAYPFVITDIFSYTIPWTRYLVFLSFFSLTISMIRYSNHSFFNVIRGYIRKGIKKRQPYSKRKLWIWRVIFSIPIIMFLEATFDLREYFRPFDQASHEAFEKALRELERPNPFQVLATGYEVEEGNRKLGLFSVDENLYDYKMQKGLKHPLVRDDKNEIVIDKTLGLMWQDNRSVSYSISEEYIEQSCKKLRLGGYDDWRVPEAYEFFALFDFNVKEGVKSKVFKYGFDQTFDCYWSSTPMLPNTLYSEGTILGCNNQFSMVSPKNLTHEIDKKKRLRCVRSFKTFKPLHRFDFIEDVNRRVVLDKGTSLMWQNEPYKVRYGKARVIHLYNEDTKLMTQKEALEYCADLKLGGYDDWYLPNVNQLLQLESLHPADFNGTPLIYPPDDDKRFHSSTANFVSHGNRRGSFKDEYQFVRCVRDAKVWNWDEE